MKCLISMKISPFRPGWRMSIRLFTDRNFAITDKEGKKIGYARSVWAMISMNTRKPADLLALHSGSIVDYVCDEPCPIEKPRG